MPLWQRKEVQEMLSSTIIVKSCACSKTKCRITTGSCGRRGQPAMFPDTFVAGAAQPERYIASENGSSIKLCKRNPVMNE